MPTNFLWSGYLASAATFLTTELNALANSAANTLTAAGSEIDNSTNKYPMADLEFLAGGTFTPLANGLIAVWFLRPLDGTNYEDGSATVAPGRMADAIIPVRAGTTITPRANAVRVPLPVGKFKPIARNTTGATLPATGNTISWRPFSMQF